MSTPFGYSNTSGRHWFKSDAYSENEIESILDPEGGESQHLPTAIPSPFARIDLVRTAFANIARTKSLRREMGADPRHGVQTVIASAEDERLVSHSLDIAQLLFMRDTIESQQHHSIEILTWDTQEQLAELEHGSLAHQRYAKSLRLFLSRDAVSYNFADMRRLYVIKFRGEIIGATSPVTMFFCTAKDLSRIAVPIVGNDVLFDDAYTPLYERDEAFQLYLHRLFKAYPELKAKMRVFNTYLEANLKILSERNPSLAMQIKNLRDVSMTSHYEPLTTSTSGEFLDVLGFQLYRQPAVNVRQGASKSDFVIHATHKPYQVEPLVLQNKFNKPLRYVQGMWDPTYSVPYADGTAIDQRTLPEQNLKYPYLTVSDFLEPYIIRLPYQLDATRYLDRLNVMPGSASAGGFALPLTAEFFKFYDVKDLDPQFGCERKPILDIADKGDAVQVTLRIPVAKAGEFITFERTYYIGSEGASMRPDIDANRGVVVTQRFGLTLFPFIKFPDGVAPHYRVQTVDADRTVSTANTRLKLRFYRSARSNDDGLNHSVESLDRVVHRPRRQKSAAAAGDLGTDYYVINENFDIIQLIDEHHADRRGIIIPRTYTNVYAPGGSKHVRFAVDFGTTNTHIEYAVGSDAPKPFDITSHDHQIAPLFADASKLKGWTAELNDMILDEFVPPEIGGKTDYKFPRRTIIAESPNLRSGRQNFALADYNIPFTYERRTLSGMVFNTNLKWSAWKHGENTMAERVEKYLENLVLLMRNKVILNGGDLKSTELVWFYPTSMTRGRRDELSRTWVSLFEEYFGADASKHVHSMSESLAPYYHFRGTGQIPVSGSTPNVNIDIGGGTTDIVVFQNNEPQLQTSFKMAANTIFGDGTAKYSGNTSAFVSRYQQYFRNYFASNDLEELTDVMDEILEKGRAQDLHAFFFSVRDHRDVKDANRASYGALLAGDEDLKVVFVYFFTAIIYHLATLMKAKGLEQPRHISFSGTGSKVLLIVTPSTKSLEDLTRRIFEDVYGVSHGTDGLTIVREPNMPKEVTCKGGLHKSATGTSEPPRPLVHTSIEGRAFEPITYRALREHVDDVVHSIKSFNEYFIKLNEKVRLIDTFNVSPLAWKRFTDEVHKDIRGYVEQEIDVELNADSDSNIAELSESPFFFGVKGTINTLTNVLCTSER